MSEVLVTGGSGFIGGHVVMQLLAAGHRVRATLRSLRREPEIRAMLDRAGAAAGDRLSFHEADLQTEAGWSEAADGCDYVLHVASPFPAGAPRSEDELVVPAREGTLRVLRAARAGGAKRVVLTSSFAAIGYGGPPRSKPFDENDWTQTSGPLAPYPKSKTLAERAAWDFIAREGGTLELTVINPVAVFGPVLGADFSASIQMIQRMMTGRVPACPRLHFGVVDVRDVAALHVTAMTHPAARGQRFLAAAGDFLSVLDIARILKARMGSSARRVPTRELPDFLVRFAGLFSPAIRLLTPELGKRKNGSHAKAARLLGWSPRSNEECIVATAESLLRLGGAPH